MFSIKSAKISIVSLLMLLSFALTTESTKANPKDKPASKGFPVFWPPREGYYYPNLSLVNYDGKQITLSNLKGKVLLIEPVGMTCPGCQAFSGAGKNGIGGMSGVVPQIGMSSIDELLSQQGLSPYDPRIVVIQIIFYNQSMQAPSLQDAKLWAKHFRLENKSNRFVLVGTSSLINTATYNMIPGFQLVDKGFVLRCDSTGHNPKNDLYTGLLPMVKKLL